MPIDVTIYACEHCYTRFDDRIECVKHEKQHKRRDVATETDMAQLCPQSTLANGDDDPMQRLNQALFSQPFSAHFENNPLSTQAAALTAACLLSGSNALELKPQTMARNETPSPQKALSSNDDASQLSASAKKRQRKTSKPMRIVSDVTPPNENSNQSIDTTPPPPPDLSTTPTRLSTLAPTMCASPASATFLPHTNIINKRGRSNKVDGSPDDGDSKFDASQSAMCDICGKVFKSRYHVRFHKQCKHGGRRFTCLVCQFTFDRVRCFASKNVFSIMR